MLGEKDTIAAIATPKGTGALAIVRLSGQDSPSILERCFAAKNFDPSESHRAFHGFIKNPLTGVEIDEVLALNFTAGRGFTGESSVEILCHGGHQVTELVLSALLDGGARLARPGEFTYRAVMNGKLDLARAESVLELIHARTPRAVSLALRNIKGALSERIEKIEDEITFVLANLEAAIDFTTEDIQPVDYSEMRKRMSDIAASVEELLSTYVAGKTISQGFRVVLAGRPNSGKSSLLNSLVGHKRSIVADQPGTTRDTVEEDLVIEGQLFRFIDTAGLRETSDSIEAEGVERTKTELNSADFAFYLVDSSIGMTNEDAERILGLDPKRVVVCMNKSDLALKNERASLFGLNHLKTVPCSSLTGEGLVALREILARQVGHIAEAETGSLVTTVRQKEILQGISRQLRCAMELVIEGASPEFIAFELRETLGKTKELLGKEAGDEVMDRVFKEFCIGK